MGRLTVRALSFSLKPLVTLLAVVCSMNAIADSPLDPQAQGGGHSYAGYSLPFFSSPVSPYGIVTQQDLSAVMVGYGLTSAPQAPASNANQQAFTVTDVNAPPAAPNITASNPTNLMLGSMLVPIDSKNLSDYAERMASAFMMPQATSLSATSSFAGSANVAGQTPNTYDINSDFAAPYNAASLFHNLPVPAAGNGKLNTSAYTTKPTDVYISLVSGALTPQATPNASGSSSPDPAFEQQVRRLAAIQSAGTVALENLAKRNLPLSGADKALYNSLSNGKFPAGDGSNVVSARDLEKFMATRRLDPASGWYNHIQQASPVELQREQLYMQAEMLYELYQLHKTEEQNQMLLAVSLLGQNYSARGMLNQQYAAAQTATNPAAAMANLAK